MFVVWNEFEISWSDYLNIFIDKIIGYFGLDEEIV